MTTLPSGLPVVVERADPVPLAVQISAQLEAAVTDGVLHAGDRLPSSRDLATSLGVSRTGGTNASARLFAEGWLEGRHGSGTYVADVAAPPAVLPVFRRRAAPVAGTKAPTAGPGPTEGADEPGGRPAGPDRPAARHLLGGRDRARRLAACMAAGGRAPPVPVARPVRPPGASGGNRRLPAPVTRARRRAGAGPDHPGRVERACAARGRPPDAG